MSDREEIKTISKLQLEQHHFVWLIRLDSKLTVSDVAYLKIIIQVGQILKRLGLPFELNFNSSGAANKVNWDRANSLLSLFNEKLGIDGKSMSMRFTFESDSAIDSDVLRIHIYP